MKTYLCQHIYAFYRLMTVCLLCSLFLLVTTHGIHAETTNWTTTKNILPNDISNSASTSYQSPSGKTFIYSIAGSHSGSPVNTVYYATIDSSGDITTAWNTSVNSFPLSVQGPAAVVYTQGTTPYIYVVGGRNGSNSASSNVYYAAINTSTGDVGTWTLATHTVPNGLLSPAVSIYQSATTPYIYVVGGQTNGFSVVATTYYASLNSSTGDVGSWNTSSHNLPTAINKAAFATYQNGNTAYMYVFGGQGSSNAYNTIYYATLNASSGDVSAWNTSATTLPTALYSMGVGLDVAGASPTIYVFGGKNISDVYQKNVYFATINSSSGDVNAFTTSNNPLPQSVFNPGSGMFQSGSSTYFYVYGGQDLNGTNLKLVYFSKTTALLAGNIQVDFMSPWRTLSSNTFGLDETEYDLGHYLTNDVLEQTRVKTLSPQVMRVALQYATPGDHTSAIQCEALGCDHTISGDTWVNAVKAVGATPMVLTPLNASDAASLVKHFNVDTNNYVGRWVVFNEPDQNSVTAASYSASFNTIAAAMKAVDPSIKIGGPTISYLDTNFMQTFLTTSGANVDFIDFHKYEEGVTPDSDATQMAYTVGYENDINTVRNLILTTVPSRASSIDISVGEWYLNYAAGDTNIYKNINSVWTASVVGHIIQAGGLANPYGTKSNFLFSAANGTYGTVLDDTMPAYHGYGMFTGEGLFRSFGTTLSSANTSLANVEVYASDNSKNIVIINKDPTVSQNATIALSGITNSTAEIWRKDQTIGAFLPPQDIGPAIITSSGTISYTIPPYSVTTIVITPIGNSNSGSISSSLNGSSNGSGQYNPNFPPGWVYQIDFGSHFNGQTSFVSGIGTASKALAFARNDAVNMDIHVLISPLNILEMLMKLIPFPWMQGINTVSSMYNYQAFSSFNGFIVTQFDHPVTIVLPYDPNLLYGRSPQSIKLFGFNKTKKVWREIVSPKIVDYTNHTIATTVSSFTYFTLGYYR